MAFLEATGVDCFAPAIGTAHGVYSTEPVLNPQRVTDLVARKPIPMVLHGGTGPERGGLPGPDRPRLRQGQHLDGAQGHLPGLHARVPRRNPDKYDPPSLFREQRAAVKDMAERHLRLFGSAGKAW